MDRSEPASFITTAGRGFLDLATYLGSLAHFLVRSIRASLRPRFPVRIVVLQVFEIGVKSLPLTGIAAFAIGLVLAMQTLALLKKFGVVHYVAVVVGLSVVKELGPVVTALMVAGRAGSGITAELGSMKVTRQIDALRVLAVDPTQYLVATRIAACMIAMPLLTTIADLLGLLGGGIIGTTLGGVTVDTYLQTTLYYVTLGDVIPGLLKTVVFGLIIGTVSAFYGFETEGGTTGVGEATTGAVVSASLMIFVSDVLMTQILVALGY
jgi:phospholipid/cholesterol/gamma-HCH transport system permease protein